MGILSDSINRKKQKTANQFISLYDSVLYLGEPIDTALNLIIDIIPQQSILYLMPQGLQAVFIINWEHDTPAGQQVNDDDVWNFGSYDTTRQEVIKSLKKSIKNKTITQNDMIYNLGFAKKRFLNYLMTLDIKPPPNDVATAESPDLYLPEDYPMDGIDSTTLQLIMDDRDELRQQRDELKKRLETIDVKGAGVNDELQAELATAQATITELQAELAKAQAKIKELESVQGDGDELSGNSKKAISKLLYALMKEHGYHLDGAVKGALNETLENLTIRHGVSMADETIKKWLEYLNDKYYYQKGK